MNKTRSIFLILSCCILILAVLAAILSHSQNSPPDTIQVGISLAKADTSFYMAQLSSITKALDSAGISFEWKSASGKISAQRTDLRALIGRNPSFLIVDPVKTIGLEKELELAAQKKIHLIFLNNTAAGAPESCTAAIITYDDYNDAILSTEALAACFQKQHAEILEVQGRSGTSATRYMSTGFRNQLCNYPELSISHVLRGGTDRLATCRNVEVYLQNGGSFNAVFAHSDEEALAVLAALQKAGITDPVPIVSVNGQQEALQAVGTGHIIQTISRETDVGSQILSVISAGNPDNRFPERFTLQSSPCTLQNLSQVKAY